MARRNRGWRRLRRVVALALAAFAAGFVWFAESAVRVRETPPDRTDAIVVLTGGAGRLEAGFSLLESGHAGKLFVTGVHQSVDLPGLIAQTPGAQAWMECCVTLGHAAGDTAGNAAETAAWMAAQGHGSLRLVTAAYHMPRSMVEFARATPGTEIVPHPVYLDHVKRNWWRWPGTASLLAGEYMKYLAALTRAALDPVAGGPG